MLADRFFRFLLVMLVGIALAHFFGLYGGGYEDFLWLDIITHFLGGAFIGGMAVWLLRKHRQYAYLIGGIVALSIGIGWEIFEILTDPFLTSDAGYMSDTIIDLVMDTAGGIGAAFLFLWLHKKR